MGQYEQHVFVCTTGKTCLTQDSAEVFKCLRDGARDAGLQGRVRVKFPWLAELYPPHLRSTAASLYHWGRIFSFFAPLLTAALVQRHGFASSMQLASVCFVVAALIWLRLPETVRRRTNIA